MSIDTVILWLDRWLLRLDLLLAGVAAGIVAIMMFLTSLDVVMRYAFNSPLPWVYDVTILYLLPAAFVLGFSYTLRSNNHISVDFFARWLPVSFRNFWTALSSAIAGIIFLYIALIASDVAWDAWVNNDVMFGTLNWPTWPSNAVIPIGIAPLALRCFHSALCSARRDLKLPDVGVHLTEEF